MAFREPRQRFGPAKRGPLPLRVAGRFAPGRQQVDALLGLAPAAGFGRMHVDAVGAAVDLRGANLDEFDQARLEAGLDLEGSAAPGFHDVGGGGEDINLGSHWTIPFVGSDDMTRRGCPSVTSPRKIYPCPPMQSTGDARSSPAQTRMGCSGELRELGRLRGLPAPALQADGGARFSRLSRVSRKPSRVASQAASAMSMNACDSRSRNGASTIFVS